MLGLASLACGRGATGTEGGRAAASGESSARVRSVIDPSRPTLRLVHREGDPHGVVAAAVFTTGGSRGALLLGHLIAHRLDQTGRWLPDAQIHGIGFIVAAEVDTAEDAARLLDALRAILVAPVTPGEIQASGLAARLRDAGRAASGPSLTRGCRAEFGAEGTAGLRAERPPTTSEVEELRSASVRSGRIGLAALGRPALLDRIAEQHQAKWPKGGPPAESWPAEDQIAVRQSGGLFELQVATRLLDQTRALAAGRALRRADHPAFVRLRALDRHLEIGPVNVALRPLGACLSLTIVRAEAPPPTADTTAAAALVLEQEVHRALRDASLEDPSSFALLAPESAVDAASLAAWTAVLVPGASAATRTLVEVVAPQSMQLTTADFAASLQTKAAAWKNRRIPVVSRTEGGQPESWLLLGSPCGTAPEPGNEAGLRALAMRAAARAFDGALSVRLEPWALATATGILAHAAPLRHETPEQLGERLARAAVQAMTLGEIDGATVAAARSEQLADLGQDPGRDWIIRALSGDRPSTLDPRGLEREVAVLSTLDVQRARHALSREPLRGAYLASARASEAVAASAELSHLLAPERSDVLPCPVAGAAAAEPGSWTVTSVDSLVQPGAFVGVPVEATPSVGFALEFLLSRDGGYLERGLYGGGMAEAARAQFLPGAFGGALILEVRAKKEDVDRALAQARGILAALAQGVPSADAKLAQAEEARRRAQAGRSPRGRVVELWLGGLPPAPGEADLRALAEQLGPDRHRIVKVDVRAQ
jgi:hypothetical protein